MNSEMLFQSLDSAAMAEFITGATTAVLYAAPGIRLEVAAALADLARRIDPELITVYLDFDERVLRMGFGDLAAVEALRIAGISVNSSPGLRISLLIADDHGFIFTPTALFLEAENRATAAPNAMRLSKDQMQVALARMSPAAKAMALLLAKTDDDRQWIEEQAVELPSAAVADQEFETVKKKLSDAPPIAFDVARQVRVYSAYLQYVELKLSGAAIQRNRVEIPKSIQRLGGDKDIESRLKTTFDLIEKGGALSSKPLEEELNQIRNNFTPSLGKSHGRVVLMKAKPMLEARLKGFRAKLEVHQETIKNDLQTKLDESRKQIADYYLQRVLANPPDKLIGRCGEITEEAARNWLDRELTLAFPKAESLIDKMQLEVRYKDMTFETLNEDGFNTAVEKAFPDFDWDVPFNDFKAAGEQKQP